MKKTLIAMIALGLFLGWTAPARAEYKIVFSYGSADGCGKPYPYYYHPWGHGYHRGHSQKQKHSSYVRVYTYGTYTPVYRTRPKEKLGISDIVVLAKAGVSDDVIIEKIARTRSVFELSAEEVEALRREGVSARVLNFMLDTTRH